MLKTTLRVLTVVIAVCALAIPASAQLTTGTVSGTIKDAQGGGHSGATVMLVSRRAGPRSPPSSRIPTATSSFPNVTPDTYTIQVTMAGFKTLERAGHLVSPGDRVARAAADDRSRRPRRDGQRHRRIAADSVAAPVSARSPSPTDSVAEPAAQRPQLHEPDRRSRPAWTSAATIRALGGGGSNNTLMDGVVDDGHRQQPAGALPQHRSDRRSEGPDLGLPGGIRPRERHPDHGRHQERHQSVPRIGLRRAPRLRLELEQLGRTSKNGNAEDRHQGGRLGLLDRRPDRQARRPQQAVLLLQPGMAAAHDRPAALNRFRFPTALERAGDFSQTLDNNGDLFNLHSRRVDRTCRVRRPTPAGCFQDGGVVGTDSGERARTRSA